MQQVVERSGSETVNSGVGTIVRAALKAGSLTSIAGTVSYLAILTTSITFASTGSEEVHLRSVLVPLTLLLGGLSILFSLPGQIAGARGSRYPGSETLWGSASWILRVAAVFAALAILCFVVFSTVGHGLLDGVGAPSGATRFLSLMALGYLPLACSDFVEGYLRGSGRFVMASALVVARALIICVGYAGAILVYGADPLSLPLFYAVGGGVTFLLGAAFVVVTSRRREPRIGPAPIATGSLVGRVGVPVLGSYILLSAVVSLQIVAVQAGAGRNAQLAFSGMQLVQTLCVVAATGVAAGVSSEVLRHSAHHRLDRAGLGAVIARTSTVIFAFEGILLVILLALSRPILGFLLVGVNETRDVATGALLLIVTSLLIANAVFVLTVLEEIGMATVSLVLNAVYFVLLIGLTYAISLSVGTFTALGAALLILGIGATIGLRILLRHLPRNSVVHE